MKILISTCSYYPNMDGISVVSTYIAEGLAKRGHDITVITSSEKDKYSFEETINNVKILRLNLYTKYGLYYGQIKEYQKLLKEEVTKCDAIINTWVQNVFTDKTLKLLDSINCKKILYNHGMFEFGFSRYDFSSIRSIINKMWKEFRWIFYYINNGKYFKKYDYVIQLHDKDYANKFFKKMYQIDSTIIENAVDDAFFNEDLKEQFKKPTNNYILYIANYLEGKNQELAIKEFYKSNIDAKYKLILIGSRKTNYYYHLIKYNDRIRKKYKLSNNEKEVIFLTNIDRNLIPYYLKNSKVFLMTSKIEKYPISLIEAMASGIPFITTNVGIAKYLLGGIVSSNKDLHYYLEKIVNDEELRVSIGKVGKVYAETHSRVCTKIDQLEKLLLKKEE